MASVNFPLTFSLAPFPTGEALDANAYGQQLVANLQAFISGNFLTGQIGGTQPTQNVGPWLNGNIWWFWDPASSTYVAQSATSALPTGSIVGYGGLTAPTGFLLCDGSSYLISAQTSLYNAIGTMYGNAGGGTFKVPDYRGRSIVGAGSGSGLTVRTVGDVFGEENHPLIVAELASHTHTDAGHAHLYMDPLRVAVGAGSAGFGSNGANFAVTPNGFAAIQSTGSGTPHNNLQPSLVASYIIRS
jgi:microcystin-dependent protein